MPWVGHERWQLIGLICVQTAFIGASSTLGIHDKGRAIAFVLIAGATSSGISTLGFGMMSLALEDQNDM
jgi:hypothetical protein